MRKLLIGAATVVALMLAGLLSPATAAEPTPEHDELVSDVVITEYTYRVRGQRPTTVTYGPETEGKVLGGPAPGEISTLAETKGGSSSASGCRKVTIYAGANTIFGTLAYRLTEWTSWCWNRSRQNIYNVNTGWSIKASTWYGWEGTVRTEKGFYDYSTNNGYPRSAYKHYRMGQFKQNNAPFFNHYPETLIRSYYNGTFAWEANK